MWSGKCCYRLDSTFKENDDCRITLPDGQGSSLQSPPGPEAPNNLPPITRHVTVVVIWCDDSVVLLPVALVGAGVDVLIIWQIVDSPGQREGGVAGSSDLGGEPGEAYCGVGRGPGAGGVSGAGAGRGGRGQIHGPARLTLTQPPTPAPAPADRVRGPDLEINLLEGEWNKYKSELWKLTLSKVWAKLAKFSNSSARVMRLTEQRCRVQECKLSPPRKI